MKIPNAEQNAERLDLLFIAVGNVNNKFTLLKKYAIAIVPWNVHTYPGEINTCIHTKT